MRDLRTRIDARAPRPIARRIRQLARELDDLRFALHEAQEEDEGATTAHLAPRSNVVPFTSGRRNA